MYVVFVYTHIYVCMCICIYIYVYMYLFTTVGAVLMKRISRLKRLSVALHAILAATAGNRVPKTLICLATPAEDSTSPLETIYSVIRQQS